MKYLRKKAEFISFIFGKIVKRNSFFFMLIVQILVCSPLFATVRFAQITDLHIFEDPKQERESKISASDLDVSLKKINQISKTLEENLNASLDFILLSGDMGIGKLLKREPMTEGGNDVPVEKEGKVYKLVKDVGKWHKAKEFMAQILQGSAVKTWLIVPGNNDLYEERHDTISFFSDFIKELQDMPEIKAAGLSLVDFRLEATQKAQSNSPPGMYVIKDFLFVGWDNSFFKNNNSVKKFVGADHKLIPTEQTGEYQGLQKLSQALKASSAKYAYIFYHIPEIDDPYMVKLDEKEKGNVVSQRLEEAMAVSPALAKGLYSYSAWTVPLSIRRAWENLVTNKAFRAPLIKGLFAGHFHDHQKKTYETNAWVKTKDYKGDILNKLYIAPPVSVKHQEKYPPSDQARGGQIVTIDDQGQMTRDIFWLG